MILEGRVIIDTAKSFVYTEGGLKGVLMATYLSGLSPNLTSRFTPGTLIFSYEVYDPRRWALHYLWVVDFLCFRRVLDPRNKELAEIERNRCMDLGLPSSSD
jgi:hypothetical protein